MGYREMENYRGRKQRLMKMLWPCVLGQCTFCNLEELFPGPDVTSQGMDWGRYKPGQVLGKVIKFGQILCVCRVTSALCSWSVSFLR